MGDKMTKPYELFSMQVTPSRKELFRRAGEVCKDPKGKVPPKSKVVEKGLLALIRLKEEDTRRRTVLEDVLEVRPREKKVE